MLYFNPSLLPFTSGTKYSFVNFSEEKKSYYRFFFSEERTYYREFNAYKRPRRTSQGPPLPKRAQSQHHSCNPESRWLQLLSLLPVCLSLQWAKVEGKTLAEYFTSNDKHHLDLARLKKNITRNFLCCFFLHSICNNTLAETHVHLKSQLKHTFEAYFFIVQEVRKGIRMAFLCQLTISDTNTKGCHFLSHISNMVLLLHIIDVRIFSSI